jgi:uncharacterized protein (TIGR02147 family)
MDYVDIIRREFNKKVSKNSRYSLRAFAKYLEYSPGSLSEILNGGRTLPRNQVQKFTEKLNLSSNDGELFRKSVEEKHIKIENLRKTCTPQKTLSSTELTKLKFFIERWEPIAILNLIEIKTIKQSSFVKEVSCYFSMPLEEALFITDKMFEYSLVDLDSKQNIIRSLDEIHTTNDVDSTILKNSHINLLELSKIHLADNLDSREYQAVTIKASRSKVKDAKILIRDFSQRLNQFLEDGSDEDKVIYQLNLQFFSYEKNNGSSHF